MKSIVIMSVLFSASTFACPSFEGTYTSCKSMNGIRANLKDVTVTQTELAGVTTYTLDAVLADTNERSVETIVADGVFNTKVDAEGVVETSRTFCEGEALVQEISFMKDHLILGSGRIVMTKNGNTIVTSILGSAGTQQMVDTLTCE